MHKESGVHVKFEMYPILHALDSKSAGREVYVDKPYVRISFAGNAREETFLPVNDQIKARFPDEWASFQKGVEAPRVGTPLHAWGRITPALAKNLEQLNIHTVEDIATLTELGLQQIGMGARPLQEDARKFLSQSQQSADLSKMDELREAVSAKDAVIAEQGRVLAELQAQMAELMAKKPGRKPKGDEEARAA